MIRKFLPAFLLLCLLFALSCSAEDVFAKEYKVANCNSYITLREDASTKSPEIVRIPLGATVTAFSEAENGFLYVNFAGERGYALKKYLLPVAAPGVSEVSLSDQERANINLFLTNFTECDLIYYTNGVFDVQNVSDKVLVEFAIDHTWFNYNESRIVWGDFEDGANVRTKDTYVREIISKYFGVSVDQLDALYFDYVQPWYYWTETGGHTPGGFASLLNCGYLGGNRYVVDFYILGNGMPWENSDTSLSLSKAMSKYPDLVTRGRAFFYAENLLDRNTFKLTRIVCE